ncbi:hypothetical protein HanHA300_Chr12g0429991 [Helianthus annuus]|nr:hypothetical protein HanHA300_Chr12g0429991 [Helianthus annuus]KAJ0673659.1 hypothetical protein HanLR1_Chr12g0431551 [Helianthus annuus]KAJ0677017.1 hypothetical protein HanOQP8_Chr12g0432341 [Helianthus annuus]
MSHSDPQNSPTAVKPHLSSVITQTIGRQLHNVASFLAPPPPQPYSSPTPPPRSDVSPSSYEGLKNDLAEIGDSLKTLLSPKKAVTGISKFASNLLQFDKNRDGDQVGVVGITDEVLDFVREVSVRPQCWVDFPLSLQNKGLIFFFFFCRNCYVLDISFNGYLNASNLGVNLFIFMIFVVAICDQELQKFCDIAFTDCYI